LRCAAKALAGTGVIEKYAGGVEPVYYVTEKGRHAASYYRNTVIHFMLVRAIAELSARAAAEDADPTRDARSWALRLRELLKFEFFFAERDAFLRELERERQRLTREATLYTPPLLAACPRILLDFLESYWVVAETVRTLRSAEAPVARSVVLRRCHELGRQLLLQDRVQSPELLSNMNFGNALKLLENLGAALREGDRWCAGPRERLDELVHHLERLIALARREAGKKRRRHRRRIPQVPIARASALLKTVHCGKASRNYMSLIGSFGPNLSSAAQKVFASAARTVCSPRWSALRSSQPVPGIRGRKRTVQVTRVPDPSGSKRTSPK
jgi:glycerol-3-phosphate O-acyltransferase